MRDRIFPQCPGRSGLATAKNIDSGQWRVLSTRSKIQTRGLMSIVASNSRFAHATALHSFCTHTRPAPHAASHRRGDAVSTGRYER